MIIGNRVITKETAEEQIKEWGFTTAEVEKLGLVAVQKCEQMLGIKLMDMTFHDLRRFYADVIENPRKFKEFAKWLQPRFDKFLELKVPLRIYVGGSKQFLVRGDKTLEKSLEAVSRSIDTYAKRGKITPHKISSILYYLNLFL